MIARTLGLGLPILVAMSLVACQAGTAGDETPQARAVSAKADVVDPYWTSSFDAVSTSAMAIGGNMRVTALNGDSHAFLDFDSAGRYTTVKHADALGLAAYSSAESASWNELLNVAMDGTVEIRRVEQEAVNASAANGGLCGTGVTTRWIALARRPESEGADSLMLAAFSSAAAPGPEADPAALCGTYFYAPH